MIERSLTTCPNCSAAIQSGDLFCEACGSAISVAGGAAMSGAMACPTCGADMVAGDAFCAQCGGLLVAAEAAKTHEAALPVLAETDPSTRRPPERIVERPGGAEWSPILLCVALGGALGGLGYLHSNLLAYGAAGLFLMLLVAIFATNALSTKI